MPTGSPSGIDAAQATPEGLIVAAGQHTATLSWRWVRDHGEDEASFNPETKQRRVYAIDAAPVPAGLSARQTQVDGEPVIEISWPTEPTVTWISEHTLTRLIDAPEPAANQVLWHHADELDAMAEAATVSDVLTSDDALRAWVADIATYGFATLRGFDAGFDGSHDGGHEATTALARRIGWPMSTIFGLTWDLASDIADHDDTAYTQSFLGPHTDGTYLHHAPGLQMFCCTERSGTGGESVVVDAFAIADTLRTEYPDDFAVLTTVDVPAHYIEPGVELRAARPAIRLDDNGHVVQVSMNNYDRSPMLLPEPDMQVFYRAYGRLHDLANDRDRWKSIRLEPGDVLINDNWRVLHGREAYTGARRFVGCYLTHEDFESKARVLAVTNTI